MNIDFAELALCDREAIEGCLRRATDAEIQEFYDLEPGNGLYWFSYFADGTTVLVIKPGFCDENCNVWALCDEAGLLAGVEITCIAELNFEDVGAT